MPSNDTPASIGSAIVATYEEVESNSRADLRNRPQLAAAVAHVRRSRAVLVIARLDRFARNVFVTSQLLESGIEFVACDARHANSSWLRGVSLDPNLSWNDTNPSSLRF